ncbi:NAD-dependent epimerase/dehydratase family protein [Aquibacillus salsiterrae]|uniref:NAD-dependent epimerase/dehydratase family protein n=1 Tax=Aquibacillus salsiterrae TaxID=2950439 RepID=A0A9X3WBS3_9BACI|nr:NAD-dependent epimerase/dehydratase family protein [Aquibacillus salsiterrae]MDC3415858.1 NAD-dependent epimerase/dehydratase family protein [Aquibacillus salsiterrae]
MNVLVTGGAGFIGSQLVRRLLLLGHHVDIVDNLHPYYRNSRKEDHLRLLKQTGTFHLFQQDLLDQDGTEALFARQNYDIVYHLAALPGVSYSIEKPLEYVDQDIKATINVLKAAGEAGVNHVVFASSSSVYGDKHSQPLREEMADGRVVSPYAASKYGAESFCHAYQSLYHFQLSIVRFFTVYGPWGRPDMAISKFANKLLNQEPIEIFGQKSARDYTYIDDIVSGLLALLTAKHTSEVFNLGSGRPVSIEQLLTIFKRHFPTMQVVERPWRTGDVTTTWANIDKAKALLDFDPTTSIEVGIEKTITWASNYGQT